MSSKEFDKIKEEEEDIYEFPGYPLYPKTDDIYNRSKEEKEIDPEDITQLKEEKKKGKNLKNNELDFAEDETGEDLDVPGSELDDEEEKVGSEDEENNYYSLGGDKHDDLEEDKGE